MADSIPATLRNKWTAERELWLQAHPKPHTPEETGEYQQKFTARIERWLDAAHGSCILRQLECREIVISALQFFDAKRYHLHSWVVMPNHVHVLMSLHEAEQLGKVLLSWKSFTANRLNDLLHLSGAFWQEDYFDRLVRDAEHFARCVRYIRRNPLKAHLPPEAYSFWEDDLSRQWAPPGGVGSS